MEFNFDQDILDYKKRLELVEEYIEAHENLSNKDLEKLGNYILFCYDKKLKKQNKLDTQHYKALVNHQKKMKTHIRQNKFKRLSLKSPYWNNRTNEVAINLNKERIESNKDILDLIDNQIDSLLNLKQQAKSTTTQGLNKSRLFKEINGDISFLNQSKKTNQVFIKEHGYNCHDPFKELDIDYNNLKVMMILIRNLPDLEVYPLDSTIHHMAIDIKRAIKRCNFTSKQAVHLKRYIDGECTKDIHMKTVELAVKKVMKNLTREI